MTKEEVAKKVEEFMAVLKRTPARERAALCKQWGMKRVVSREKSSFGKRNTKSKNHHWDEIDLTAYRSDKPVMVCFSGNGAVTVSEANGFCKTAENMLGLLFKDKPENSNPEDYIDFISCAYGKDKAYLYYPEGYEIRDIYSDLNDYKREFPLAYEKAGTTCLGEGEAEKFVAAIMLPRCVDEKGGKLDIDTCCKNMAEVSFFSYCYGSQAVNLVIDTFEDAMLKHGFSKEEIEKINSSMKHISFARKEYTRKIPTIFFYAANDYAIGSIDQLRTTMQEEGLGIKTKLCNKKALAFGQDMAEKKFGNQTGAEALEVAYIAISDEEKEGFSNQDEDHNVMNLARDRKWNIVFKNRPRFDAISQMMAWSMGRIVEYSLINTKANRFVPFMPLKTLNEEILSIYDSIILDEIEAH